MRVKRKYCRTVMRRVLLLGATGSIGRQTIDVITRSTELSLVGALSNTTVDPLVEDAVRLGCPIVGVVDDEARKRASSLAPDSVQVLDGAVDAMFDATQPDIVLNAVVGYEGLKWTVAALNRGVDVALANKESMVAGGPTALELINRSQARILPVDSEHNALHQLLEAGTENVERLTITASGGPFRGRKWVELADVSVEQALAHPTWAMGPKNTLDSATLVNKGLELIETRYLFDWPAEKIEVAVQSQSIIHASVTLKDGTVVSNMSSPDMRRSISYALHYPQLVDIGLPPQTLAGFGDLTIHEPPDDFPALDLARTALQLEKVGGTAVYNASNEIAVEAFIQRRIGFTDITRVIDHCLSSTPDTPVSTFAEVEEVDAAARRRAGAFVTSLG